MATTMFSNVTGFHLKFPSYYKYPTVNNHGNWIELHKNKNELPTATLRTWVLYYRNNGGVCASENNPPEDQGEDNYRFYNNLSSFYFFIFFLSNIVMII